MVFRVCIFSLVILFFVTEVHSTCLEPFKAKACKDVFSPEAMKQSCCPPMNQFVERIAQCQKKSKDFTCRVSVCVTTVYGILTNGKIDETKCRSLLKNLTRENPKSEPLNREVERNCLKGQYKMYRTIEPYCDTANYQVCAFVNYLNGCQKFNTSPSYCKTLAHNVATCKPVTAQYLKQINSKACQ